jgi:hypothetical protein
MVYNNRKATIHFKPVNLISAARSDHLASYHTTAGTHLETLPEKFFLIPESKSIKSNTINHSSSFRTTAGTHFDTSRKVPPYTGIAIENLKGALQSIAQVRFRRPPGLTLRHFLRGSQRYSVILSTRIQPMVRTARARIRGFGS